VWNDPPKTLSSRFQALSHLQAPATPAAAERPLVPAKRAEQQSRIVLLAPLPEERKPALGWHACNALNPRSAAIYSEISWRPGGHRGMRTRAFPTDIAQHTGTILRHQAGGIIRPAVGVPLYTQSAV
jgi:hypothetical protein